MHKLCKLSVCVALSLLLLQLSHASLPPSPPVLNNSGHIMSNAESNNMAEYSRRLAIFSVNMYNKLSLMKPNENVVFSPFSIQSCAAMARLGAEGETAAELDRGLGLVSTDERQIAESFHQVISAYEKSDILRIANKIYVMQGYNLRAQFNELLSKQFLSGAENVDFSRNAEAAGKINTWVEQQTNHLIKDLVPASALDGFTRLVLVNAIHFKGNWVHEFPAHATRNDKFHLNNVDSIDVPMMNVKARFRYANLPNLDASALEMPYKDSDLSMLIVLPNTKTGLSQLEEKLRSTPISLITEQLRSTEVQVKLPKFKAEFQVELSEAFQQLGMTRMFSDNAQFGKMLTEPESLKVSAIIHKAFIDVNEQGTEAAAATGMVMCFASMPMFKPEPERFYADHAFNYYIINNQNVVLFAGREQKL
ncbi:serine protease inhibitor 42Dd isoform X2 [Drosophila busckii]|uniref:serine protease inhibitor 42Dd isoform X2 n=1 Tax=Drosophila busckii TaxID=30019 RepID=UPI00083F1200|nr:serine protease inhibitor 42Dd isoform X2 [Drosophila busckii]